MLRDRSTFYLRLLQLNALKRFLKLKPSHSDHESLMKRLDRVYGRPQSVAVSVFMETAATAALFSKAVALVVDYILNNSKAKDVHNHLHPKDVKGDGKVISLIREALRKKLESRQLESIFDSRVCRPSRTWTLLGWASSRR